MFISSTAKSKQKKKGDFLGDSKKVNYFYFYKYDEASKKKGLEKTPYEKVIAEMSHEDKILQKNLKILLYDCDNIEQCEFNIYDKNSVTEILKVIEHTIEKGKAQKKFS